MRSVGRGPRRRRPLTALLVTTLVLVGCVVDDPAIEATTGNGRGVLPLPTPTTSATGPVFVDPTPTPIGPVATPTPIAPVATPTPEATATPAPTPTATPVPGPTPIAPVAPTETVTPVPVPAGQIAIPIADRTSFVLAQSRPILQLPGHTLIYIDEDRLGEVDIFTPVADGAGTELSGVDEVVGVLQTTPAFAGLSELPTTSVAGFPTRVFEGTLIMGDRGFYTDLTTLGNDAAGWFPPARTRMWLIDAPLGVVALTAESLEDPGQYSDAIRLATEILATITFAE